MNGEKERGRDLAVRPPFCDEGGDSALRLRQRTRGTGTATHAGELAACLLGPERRSDALEARERIGEAGTGRATLLRPSLGAAEGEEGARVLKGSLVRACSPRASSKLASAPS